MLGVSNVLTREVFRQADLWNPDKFPRQSEHLSYACMLDESHNNTYTPFKEKKVAVVAHAFRQNVNRAVSVVASLPMACLLGRLAHLEAEAKQRKFMEGDYPDAEAIRSLSSRGNFRDPFSCNELHYIREGFDLLNGVENPRMQNCIESLLLSELVGIWGAFETLAGDLWEEAVNCCPRYLARMGGQQKRIEKMVSSKTSSQTGGADQSSPGKQIDLKEIDEFTGGGFDLSRKMGTFLRDWNVGFSSLEKIRRAYSASFTRRHERVDELLSNKHLDTLALIRNLIVHKAAIADEEFVRRVKVLPVAPTLNIGERLIPNGVAVLSLVQPVVRCGVDLIREVDEWLSLHRDSESEA